MCVYQVKRHYYLPMQPFGKLALTERLVYSNWLESVFFALYNGFLFFSIFNISCGQLQKRTMQKSDDLHHWHQVRKLLEWQGESGKKHAFAANNFFNQWLDIFLNSTFLLFSIFCPNTIQWHIKITNRAWSTLVEGGKEPYRPSW